MDCLDRTNVVQSLLATENLQAVLVRMGVLKPDQDLLDCSAFQVAFYSDQKKFSSFRRLKLMFVGHLSQRLG
jgi:hypothetical protein